ncbi:MAG TPA: hypothetical protein VKS21_09470 [Spirochaetota bacterium]|nr:hypothetical protein [Spirochaetota bacterium]
MKTLNKLFSLITIILLLFAFSCDDDNPSAPGDDGNGSASSSSSSSVSSTGSSSSAAGGFTFDPASPVYYDDGFPNGWADSTHYGVFDYTADYNYTADTPAATSTVIRLTDSSAAWTGLWFNSSDAGTLDLNTLSSKSLVFDMKVPDSVNVKFESDAGANGVAGWYGSTFGSWETITIPISDFINISGGTYEIGSFDASAASALVFLEDHTATDGQDYLIANIRIE